MRTCLVACLAVCLLTLSVTSPAQGPASTDFCHGDHSCDVHPRRYGFRVLNAANARFFHLTLAGERSFQQIGSDQGLFAASFTSGAIPDSGQRRFDQSEWLASPSFRRCKNGIGRYFVPRIANCAALSRSTG